MPGPGSASADAGRQLVDAHAHIWRRSRPGLEWLAEVPEVDRDADLAALRAAAPASVGGFVLVQAVNDAAESVELLAAAAGSATAASSASGVVAVVGWVDLAAEDAAEQLAALAASPGGERLAGIRHLAHIDPDPEWLVRAATAHGLDAVARAGLAVDLVLRAGQLPLAARAADAHEGLLFVLDHLGQPPADAATPSFDVWERGLRELARRPNVVAKVSGIAERRTSAAARRRLDRVLEVALDAFGPRRLMVGSDWPLVDLADGYGSWVQDYLAATRALSAGEQHALDRGTALASYRPAD
ncbi:amidohydrolase family protein [Herbiconiux sp. VKM Ac-1786]|uniref:amidohydrolase family protein n=1 Tax=Herbiconiux sp. VKM Ac-1786 TaxID=2783824 RepID=UPI001889F8F7|nr:amidohydrolase family protein [Herbiconiux sp. VKM Ac-1786]MBF4572732.1 amidohydrolase family protein [Herbiconiux sp. VKM Ac-1786]